MRNESLSKKNRKYTIDEMIEILLLKENKETTCNNINNFLSFDKKISKDVVKRIWNGSTKIFQDELEEKNISYNEYLRIIAIDRKNNI